MLADLYAREIIELEAKGTSEDEEDAKGDVKELRKTRQSLDEKKEAIANLETFYKDIKAYRAAQHRPRPLFSTHLRRRRG